MTKIPKTRLQVMWNRLLAVVEEQGQALIRAASSANASLRNMWL